ncbi:NAD(P)H-hydrate epimerase [Chloroflexota bacterium]
MNIPAITTDQMREVDRLMIDVYGIELIQMMENAGRNLAALAHQVFLNGDPVGKNVLVLAGSGGNGGGGLVAARHLHNRGAQVRVYTTKKPIDFEGVPSHQLNILIKIGVPVFYAGDISELPKTNIILDAIIGYSLRDAPRGQAANLIKMANERREPILSLDVPSGLDTSSGKAYDPHIQSAATLTLALPKVGLLKKNAKSSVGVLYLADISVPPQLYESLGLRVGPIFAGKEIIRF